jgi:putative ABC transport system ATP-binding protein
VVAQPRLILADEPTSALDDGNAERAFSLLRDEARACGAGLLIATHDGRLKALLANRLELAAR